jgi:hypothetical protein
VRLCSNVSRLSFHVILRHVQTSILSPQWYGQISDNSSFTSVPKPLRRLALLPLNLHVANLLLSCPGVFLAQGMSIIGCVSDLFLELCLEHYYYAYLTHYQNPLGNEGNDFCSGHARSHLNFRNSSAASPHNLTIILQTTLPSPQ